MNPTNSELKCCPFCASLLPAKVERKPRVGVFVVCPSCCAQGSSHSTEAEAIAAWNTRKSEALADDAVERLRTELAKQWLARRKAPGALSTLTPSPTVDMLREAREAWKSIVASMKRYGMESTAIETVDDYFDAALKEAKDA